jgi:hypothetical protein
MPETASEIFRKFIETAWTQINESFLPTEAGRLDLLAEIIAEKLHFVMSGDRPDIVRDALRRHAWRNPLRCGPYNPYLEVGAEIERIEREEGTFKIEKLLDKFC